MPRNVKNLRIYISNLSYVVFLSVKTWIFFSLYLPLYLNLIVHLCVLSSSLGLKILMNLIKQLKKRKEYIDKWLEFLLLQKNAAMETFCTYIFSLFNTFLFKTSSFTKVWHLFSWFKIAFFCDLTFDDFYSVNS